MAEAEERVPWDTAKESLATGFHKLFDGMDRAYGIYHVNDQREDDGKRIGRAATKTDRHVDVDLWELHLAGKQGLGIIPIRDGDDATFGAIDVDTYTGLSHKDIVARLGRLKIPILVCRSKSGGAHLYLFAKELVSASKMQAKLREIASLIGYGGSEIFPKQTKILSAQGDVGQWINMPYFGGVRGLRYCVTIDGDAMTPEVFLACAETVKQAKDWFDQPIVILEEFVDGPPCLQILSTLGYPPGTRNDGLYNIGVYLKKSVPDNWENQLHVINSKLMSPPLTQAEVQGVAKSLQRKDWNYKCSQQPICQHCNSTLCRTRKFGIAGSGQGKFPSLGGLTKLDTKPPIWFWTVEGIRMELQTGEIQDPRRFQARCMEALNQMPPVPSNVVWQAAVQHAMDSVTVVEAPKDASPEGQFWEMVERFCTGRAQAMVKDELATGKPHTADGRTYFRLQDLLSFLQRNKFTEFRTTKITSLLKDAGAEHHTSNFKGRCVNYWSVAQFAQQTSKYEVPGSITDTEAF